MNKLPRVLVCSPYAPRRGYTTADNIAYARLCMHDSLMRNEAPFLSHLLYTQVLADTDHASRTQGLAAEHAWLVAADLIAVYTNHGISPGMELAIAAAVRLSIPVEYRSLASADHSN